MYIICQIKDMIDESLHLKIQSDTLAVLQILHLTNTREKNYENENLRLVVQLYSWSSLTKMALSTGSGASHSISEKVNIQITRVKVSVFKTFHRLLTY
jgi:hypothetical protein